MVDVPQDGAQLVATLIEGPDRRVLTKVPRPAPASIRQVLSVRHPPYDTREYRRLGETTEYRRVDGPPADTVPTCALCRTPSHSKLYATGKAGTKHYCPRCYALMVSTGEKIK